MKKTIITILLAISTLIHSNGGPIDWTEVLKTGQVEFKNLENFTIEEEVIKLKIDGDYTIVNVLYKIKNNGSDQNVTYTFPIDVSSKDSDIISKEIDGFEMFDNSNPLSFSLSDYTETTKITYPEIFDSRSTVNLKSNRMFYITNLDFLSNEVKELRIKYKVKNQLLSLITTKSMIPSFTERIFYYDVTPSKNWGNGIVKKFSYNIDFTDVIQKEGTFPLLPDNGQWNGFNFSFIKDNYDLNNAEDIIFSYDITKYLESTFFKEKMIKKSSIKSLNASSTLAPEEKWDYKVENLFDNNYKTVWVEGSEGNGIGDYIEIELENFNIGYIGIINGHNHSEKTYTENSRAIKIKYEMELDENGPYYRSSKNIIEGTFDLKDIGFRNINSYNFSESVQRIFKYGDGGVPTKKVKLSILSALDGSKYNDLCISEIIILGYTYEELQ